MRKEQPFIRWKRCCGWNHTESTPVILKCYLRSSHFRKNTIELEKVPRRSMRVIQGMGILLKKRKLWCEKTETGKEHVICLQMRKGIGPMGENLSSRAQPDAPKDHL